MLYLESAWGLGGGKAGDMLAIVPPTKYNLHNISFVEPTIGVKKKEVSCIQKKIQSEDYVSEIWIPVKKK